MWAQMGQIAVFGGQIGGVGGSTFSVGESITIATIVSSGAGGGGESSNATSYSGGSITGTMYGFRNLNGGTNNVNTTLVNGNSGYFTNFPSHNSSSRSPMFFVGGSGGGATNTSGYNGGRGGNGSYGCGGGGGGAAYQGTGGNGGNGGGGLVIISCW